MGRYFFFNITNNCLTYLTEETIICKNIMEMQNDASEVRPKNQREIWTDFIYNRIKNKYLPDETSQNWPYHCLSMLQYYVIKKTEISLDDIREFLMAYCDAIEKLVLEGESFEKLFVYSFPA